MESQSHANGTLLFLFAEECFPNLADDMPCQSYKTAVLFCTLIVITLLIAISHVLHLLLKKVGQPRIVSQMLSGFILGPIIFGRLKLLDQESTQLEYIGSTVSIFFMFLAGLEVDLTYLKRTIRAALVIMSGNIISYVLISIVVCVMINQFARNTFHVLIFFFSIFLMLFNTSSPTLIRVIDELKLTMTETGRVAMSVALLTDLLCLVILAILGFVGSEQRKLTLNGSHRRRENYLGLMYMAVVTAGTVLGIKLLVRRVNKRNPHKRVVGIEVVFYLLFIVTSVCMAVSHISFDPMLAAFLFGVVVPREGPTARTLVEELSQLVNNLVLPIYFGVAALQMDLSMLMKMDVAIMALVVFVLGMFGKIGGLVAGVKYLGMPMDDAILLSLLLNVRGHVNLMILNLGKRFKIWVPNTYMALLIALFMNSMVACNAATYFVDQKRKRVQRHIRGLEWLNQGELRMIACVHSPGDLPTILDLIELSNVCHVAPFILHLRELTGTAMSTVLHHQRQLESDDDLEGSQAQQICSMIDIFVRQTRINLRQLRAISHFNSMHKDLNNAVQDVHAFLAIVPFHRKQRFDGKMGTGKEDVRQFNINVLHHAPCSVGILVDRRMDKRWGAGSPSLASNMPPPSPSPDDHDMKLNAVVLFLGGPDDREAASYAGRLALHPCVNLTMVRFLPTFRSARSGIPYSFTNEDGSGSSANCVAMEVKQEDADETFMSTFYSRFIVTEIISYAERMVQNSAELITAITSIKGMYSLYIVGRHAQGPAAHLTLGMSDWAESPELGAVGDLLSSTDFMTDGSVLVIRQCKPTVNSAAPDTLLD